MRVNHLQYYTRLFWWGIFSRFFGGSANEARLDSRLTRLQNYWHGFKWLFSERKNSVSVCARCGNKWGLMRRERKNWYWKTCHHKTVPSCFRLLSFLYFNLRDLGMGRPHKSDTKKQVAKGTKTEKTVLRFFASLLSRVQICLLGVVKGFFSLLVFGC